MENRDLIELENTQKVSERLLNTPHYKKMGSEGIFAIVSKAKSIGVNIMDALNGGMYYVKGRVELSSCMMNQLIRQAGHSITKDRQSTEEICILHGKRKDTGDTWVESFSIQDAKKAGILSDSWRKYPKDMLFARALTRLARQLFPDVIKGCYIEGELSAEEMADPELNTPKLIEEITEYASADQVEYIQYLLSQDQKLAETTLNLLHNHYKVTDLNMIPMAIWKRAVNHLETTLEIHKEEAC